ncbi:MAG: hypothetical protein M3410_10500 [Acidobacteriota bacterium]|nr:hypothetical protein [Acidobacteriota bacterium]
MSRSQFSIITFAPLIIGAAFLDSPVLGQTVSSLVVARCVEGSAPGRPTLKRRQPALRILSLPSVSGQQLAEKEMCGNPDISPNVANVASVEARQDEEANTMVLLVSEGPRFSIGEIRFEGNRLFSSQELTATIGEFLREYSKSGYDAEIFEVCLRRLTNFVRNRGYLQAKLGEPKKELIEGGLVVTIPVEEGALYRLGEIKIEGAENLNQQQVRAMLSLQRGDIANGEAIGKWLFEDLKKLYGEMGYIQYTAEPEPEFRAVDHAANEGVVDFKVTIEEGRQFRIRAIKFEGSNGSERELHNLLLIRAGDVFDPQLFEKSINQLNETGWFEMIDKDKDTDFKTNEEEALVDITLRLKRVRSR